MKDRPYRWERFRNQDVAQQMKHLHHFTAVDGRKISLKNNRNISIRTKLNILRNYRRSHQEIATMGAIGASLSHIGIWKKFVSTGQPYAMVFEDDAELTEPTFDAIQREVSHLPKGWGVWLLGAQLPNAVVKPMDGWQQVQNFTAAHAQMITREAAKKFLEEALPIENHIDHQMSAASILKDVLMVRHPKIQVEQIKVDPLDRSSTSQKQFKKNGCPVCKVSDDLSQLQVGAPKITKVVLGNSITPKNPLRVKGVEVAENRRGTRKHRR